MLDLWATTVAFHGQPFPFYVSLWQFVLMIKVERCRIT